MTYGMPYMGSKQKLAKDIFSVLPKGKRFVDLFGGGGAMSHYAIANGLYESVLYNEINPLVVETLRNAIGGKYSYDRFRPEFVTHAEFNEQRFTNGYVACVWSFGNDWRSYLFGKDAEEKKHILHDWVVFDRRERLGDILPSECHTMLDGIDNITRRRLALRRLGRYAELQQLEQLEINCGSYLDYKYRDGDVVYCDIPYDNTKEYRGKNTGFDKQVFLDWCKAQSFPIYVSEHSVDDNAFAEIWNKDRVGLMDGGKGRANRKKYNEKLYVCNGG